MTTDRHNYVSIYVHDEHGNATSVEGWKFELPEVSERNILAKEWDRAHPQPYVTTRYFTTVQPREFDKSKQPAGNEIRFLFSAGRSQTKRVAMNYFNEGHADPAAVVEHSGKDLEWPAAETELAGSTMRSASMSAKGDHEAPEKLNFYFPVKITTREGLVLDLLLAQSGGTAGFLKRMYHVARAIEHGVKAGVEYYDGAEEEALEETQKLAKDLKNIANDNHNPWYVTVIGTRKWPAVAVDKHLLAKKRVRNSLLYTGPAGTAAAPRIQSARFYYYSEKPPVTHSYYTFNLTLYQAKLPTPALIEEKTETRVLFIDENSVLHRHRLDEPGGQPVIASGVPSMVRESDVRNVFAGDGICCYFLESTGVSTVVGQNKFRLYKMVVCNEQGVELATFRSVTPKPVIHRGKVYFAHEDLEHGIGISCFDPARPKDAAVSVVTCGSIPTGLTISPGSDELYGASGF